ncbi:MAG: NlpC/P60 family protein [Ignavibacteriae bacterium]|nr:MAG: NlpC/P60 family protein [Ignavibacteriota bacterium]
MNVTRPLLASLLLASLLLASCASSKVTFSTGNATTDVVLTQASELQGTPYCSAGDDPDCFDCSGFVSYCFAKAGITVPRTSTELYTAGTSIDVSEIRPGDLVFFNTTGKGVSHVGICLDAQTFIHSSTSSGVIKTSLGDPYWNKLFLGARRIVAP